MLRLAIPRNAAGAAKQLHGAVRLASSSASRKAPSQETFTQTSTLETEMPPGSSSLASQEQKRVDMLAGFGALGRSLTRRQRERALRTHMKTTKELKTLRAKLVSALGFRKDEEAWMLQEPAWYAWREENPDSARLYTSARTRLWKPSNATEEDLDRRIQTYTEHLEARINSLSEALQIDQIANDQDLFEFTQGLVQTMSEQLQAWLTTPREEQLDIALCGDWMQLGEGKQQNAVLRARYECLRKLGWRKGYTSGYPLAPGAHENAVAKRSEMLQLFREGKRAGRRRALEIMHMQEEQMAKEEWLAMPETTRKMEERAAWEARDRSLVYLDDTSTSHVLGARSARWFAVPQRAGEMTFLPNIRIRLVPNFTPRNGVYDAFKATFRVPLNMHKHSLRSYLLAIYGLRTTWARSMIYRSRVRRDFTLRFVQKKHGSQTTYKKVEVGLIEPFIFPDISPTFRRIHIKTLERQAMYQRVMLRLTGKRRWRGRVLPKPVEQEVKIGSVDDGLPLELEQEQEQERLVGTVDEDGAGAPQKRQLATHSGKLDWSSSANTIQLWGSGIPTKRHSNIITLIHQQRAAKEKEVRKRAEAMRAESDAVADARRGQDQ